MLVDPPSLLADSVAPSHYFSRLQLYNFRNHQQLDVEIGPGPVMIAGVNGLGKTNVLEALSLFSPGRGLRQAKLSNMQLWDQDRPWVLHAVLESACGTSRLGTAYLGDNKRQIKLNGENLSQTQLIEHVNIMWLTPQMDGLFIGPQQERRKYLDRMVAYFDSHHLKRVQQYDHALRERFRLLKMQSRHVDWIAGLERKMCEAAVAIAAARLQVEESLNYYARQVSDVFLPISLELQGDVENFLRSHSALETEQYLADRLVAFRVDDVSANRTHVGTHRSDFKVLWGRKRVEMASTGEQKMALLSLTLAEARARSAWRHMPPILLMDEVIAHLDAKHRSQLYDEFLLLNMQIWMTGTDAGVFDSLENAFSLDLSVTTAA